MSNELLGLNQNKMTDLLHKSLSRILPHLSKGFIYSFMRDREKGAETESEGEAGSSQGAQRGTRFQIPRPRPEPKANAQPLSHPGISVKSYHLGAMSLKPFTYPFPETRFLHAGPNVYKFKIRYGNNIRGEEIEDKEVIVQELEDSIRVVLGNLDSLQPFATEHFIIFPYKSKWESISHLKFKHGEIVLVPYPFVFTLYVEMKWFHESLSAGKPIKDSPLGLVLTERKAAGAMMRKRKQVEVLSSPSRPGLDRAKIGISSQSPSKKKPLMETRRNREGKTHQEWQETPAFNITDVQEQDSKSEDSPAGQIIPPLQQNNPLPPKGPTELATGGFFGFLRYPWHLPKRCSSACWSWRSLKVGVGRRPSQAATCTPSM
ncbi:glycoprotein hormone alpha-2 isoform X6 [Canis lupus baileyi]|uniref:glycoprotein hormone alpha-2 isoform X5 n=1 Tax=Canis lupus dingo TaxID=286419 RepID=UPI0020C56C36|nr:glycoprotein hormone alpha-2 isoform X5 [Canis lupus dingo]